MKSTLLILSMCMVLANCLKCGIPPEEDIDWNRVRPGRWYDVVDIPHTDYPVGCWEAKEVVPTKVGISFRYYIYVGGEQPEFLTDQNFTRQKPGVYRLSGADSLLTAYDHLLDESKKSTKEMIVNEANDFAANDWTFFTDYETYMITITCHKGGWKAFAKFNTPQITVAQLQNISKVLVDHGWISPVMSLKNECLNKGQQDFDEAATVLK
uniref:uncharacterized protein LOC120338403 n=1 Tax=Styela clava TaxID=7725 RepID=UPI00193AA9DC|nr:uncharacterized protein LOC120338403 [Styela clava]